MSRKCNTKHNRGRSKYPQRLAARGETGASVRMKSVESLRKKQTHTEEEAEETDAA